VKAVRRVIVSAAQAEASVNADQEIVSAVAEVVTMLVEIAVAVSEISQAGAVKAVIPEDHPAVAVVKAVNAEEDHRNYCDKYYKRPDE